MESITYRKVLVVFISQYPLYWLILAVSSVYFSHLFVWLLNAETIGGNDGPTSIFIVGGTLNFSLALDLLGAVLLLILVTKRKLYPKALYFRVAGVFALSFWFISVSKYLLWLI